MATTTNYINDLASMRQFLRSLTFGNHNRGKVNVRGIKESQHDDVIRRLDYFDIMRHIYTQRIGKASIHHLDKNDFLDGYNYLNQLYELYAAVPEQIYVQLCILSYISCNENVTITDLYQNMNADLNIVDNYVDLVKSLFAQRNKKQEPPTLIDQQYIQRQVKTLEILGIITKTEGSKRYTIKNTIIEELTKPQLQELAKAVFFFTSISITSAAGHILLKKIMYLLNGLAPLKQQENSAIYAFNNTFFAFKDNNPNNVIDGDIFYPLADALHRHRKVRLSFYEPGKPREIVTPLSLQTYYGENKNILCSINNGIMQRNRVDRIKSLEVTRYNASDFIPDREHTSTSTDTCMIHFLTLEGYQLAYDQFSRQFKNWITVLNTTDEYIEIQLDVPDALQLLPLLRSYLPYVYITHSSKPSIKNKFYSNLYASLGLDFVDPEGYKKKKKINRFLHPYPKKKDADKEFRNKSKKDPDIDGTYVSSVLNDINAITFTTQYQLQLDLINGIAYTESEIDDVINQRDLLTPALYKKALRNDDYEHLLAHALIETTEDGEEVESILPDLPLVIISDAERMFLKDLISDARVSWLLSEDLLQLLTTTLDSVDTTFPANTWTRIPTMTDDTPASMDVVIQCLQAIESNVRITLNDKDLSPCRLEYSVASNGYTLIAYDHTEETFRDFSLHDVESITVSTQARLDDLEIVYATYREESKQTISFILHDANNAVDRCFNYFSNYTIQAKNITAEEFTIEVSYLPFQEQDILRHLLKLGCAIRILDDCPLRDRLETIYKTALVYAPSNE